MNKKTIQTSRFAFLLLASAFAARIACAQSTLVCDGVLGNSGEQGKTLVRFAPQTVSGMGVAYDRFGSLWSRAGAGKLNRYAIDGRLLAQYSIPNNNGSRDWEVLTLTRDRVVLLLGDQLYALPLDAPNGSEVVPLKVQASRMAFGTVGNQIAAWNNGELFLLDVVTGQIQQAGSISGDFQWMEMGPDGAIYPVVNRQTHKFVGGVEVKKDWPKGSPGERPQLLDNAWWGHNWHGTVKRFNAAMEPDPGVVVGGASGSFIGHLDQNSEIENGRGLAKISDTVYAVSGMGGVVNLLVWQPELRQFSIARRIGAIPFCRGLGLDKKGNVWWFAGSWQWNDAPTAPLRFGVNAPEGAGIGQAVMLPNDRMIAPGYLWGQPGFYVGALTGEISAGRTDKSTLSRDALASAVYRNAQNELVLLTITAQGVGQTNKIGDDGSFLSDGALVVLQTATPVKEWTTLAMKDESTLLGAGDGFIIEFTRDGDNWKESRRWNSWGNGVDAKFGAQIYITADAGRLWVSDRDRQRVLGFDLKTNTPVTSFGTPDRKADDLTGFDAPTIIAARDNRVVVYDSGNQRLIKLRLK